MKRGKKIYGYLQGPDGKFPLFHEPTAKALEELSQHNGQLGERVRVLNDELGQRNLQLATLQNTWWVRLGEALRLVKVKGV